MLIAHVSSTGPCPMIVPACRDFFVSLVDALSCLVELPAKLRMIFRILEVNSRN